MRRPAITLSLICRFFERRRAAGAGATPAADVRGEA